MNTDSLLAPKISFDVRINVRNIRDGKDIEDPVFSHRHILTSCSLLFRSMLEHTPANGMASMDLDIRLAPNGLAAFKAMHFALYTAEISYVEAQPAQVLYVARICQVPIIENLVLTKHIELNPFALFLSQFNPSPAQSYLQSVQSLLSLCVPSGAGLLAAQPGPTASGSVTSGSISSEDTSQRSSSDCDSPSSPISCSKATSSDEKTLPNDDKDGWCRNKKYIEKIDQGYMCTVCRKIYGRYNSVSYHVTIYHRNPPIRCDEAGCQFSTREARYIHFHKYYRHHIPLPESIDLGTRKCPLCRHVSKSPAMLEKHISRHQVEPGTMRDKSAQLPRIPKLEVQKDTIECIPSTSQNIVPAFLEHQSMLVSTILPCPIAKRPVEPFTILNNFLNVPKDEPMNIEV